MNLNTYAGRFAENVGVYRAALSKAMRPAALPDD